MTGQHHSVSDLRRLLEVAGQSPTPTDLDDLLTRTARTRQRPAWSIPERWLPVNIAVQEPTVAGRRPSLRAIALIALLALGLAAGAVFVAGRQPRLPAPFGLASNGLVAYVDPADGYGALVDAVYRMPFGDILTADPVTGHQSVLVAGPTLDGNPVYSPDGTRIAFVRETDAGRSLYVMELQDGALRALTPRPMADIRDPAWSPDGSSIAFTAPDGDLWQLWIARTDGSEVRQVVVDGASSLGLPQWRPPDGAELLVLGSNSPGLLTEAGYRGLWGGDDVSSSSGVDLFRVRADGSSSIQVTKTNGVRNDYAHTQWSQDGQTIVTQRADPAGNLRVVILDADGVDGRVIDPDPGIETMYPIVSPDGRQIAFADLSPGDSWRLRVAPIDDTTAPVTVADFGGGAAAYGWSPDGRSLIVTHHFHRETWLVDVEKRTKTKVSWIDPGEPAWQRTAD